MDPFLGEIRLMAINFPPRGWAFCQGQLIPISQNTALFSLLGTQYGGDGRTSFALPDLRGRAALGVGQGPGTSNYTQGEVTGTEGVTLLTTQMPAHMHAVKGTVAANSALGTVSTPVNGYLAAASSAQYSENPGGGQPMAADLVTGQTAATGSGQSHENRMPFLALNYCIALQGVFPQRS
ncbi:phage tail protein [Hymenobacter negativus]|uniref:Phage tail protein n=1 Tax=Hymenobacter negativus TaxID=2795026 RepID=A0ABS3QIK8_9BACT|nr:tail fiber protein [Hymenobacter negativus]MBO2010987.1 phage tail protein [Hymenobacter negativus]